MAEQKHTAFAMQAVGFADLFNVKVGDQKVSGHRVELSAPEGPSTGGGKQSVQHVKLVSPDGSSVIVAGSANQMDKTAEVRTFEYVADLHAKRYKGAKLPVDKPQYNLLVARMKAFFAEQDLSVSVLDAPRDASAPVAKPASSGATMAVIFAVIALLAAGAAFFILHKH